MHPVTGLSAITRYRRLYLPNASGGSFPSLRRCLLERLRRCLLERLRRCLLERLRRGAGTYQVAVTVGRVNAAHWRPVLGPPVAAGRVGGRLPVITVLPVTADQHAG